MFLLVHSLVFSPKSPAPGIRLFYIDRDWVLRSRLIAVRQFNPTKDLLMDNRLSGLLEKYLESVLEEYGLDTTLLFSATSDSGSDVKRLCTVLLPGLWEWCVCHIINCALVEVRLRCSFFPPCYKYIVSMRRAFFTSTAFSCRVIVFVRDETKLRYKHTRDEYCSLTSTYYATWNGRRN